VTRASAADGGVGRAKVVAGQNHGRSEVVRVTAVSLSVARSCAGGHPNSGMGGAYPTGVTEGFPL
jgi:hypothetical protein